MMVLFQAILHLRVLRLRVLRLRFDLFAGYFRHNLEEGQNLMVVRRQYLVVVPSRCQGVDDEAFSLLGQ